MKINNLLIWALLLVTVHGAEQQQQHGRKVSHSLPTNEETVDDIVTSPQSASGESCRPDAAEQQESCTVMVSQQSASGGITAYVFQGTAMVLDLPGDATVATLVAATADSTMDLKRRTLMFGDELLSDASAPLSSLIKMREEPDAWHGDTPVIEVSPLVWNRETLDALRPMFKAEIQLEGKENIIVFLQWNDESSEYLNAENHSDGQMPSDILVELLSHPNRILAYGQQYDLKSHLLDNGVYVDTHFSTEGIFMVKLDVSRHLLVKDSGNDIELPIPCTVELPISCNIQEIARLRGLVPWSFKLTEVVHVKQKVTEQCERCGYPGK